MHKHSASLTLCFLAVLSVYIQFHYGWLINRYLTSGGWTCSHSLPFTAVIAAVLGCWEEARMFLGHQLPMFSANTALLDLTSCFLSPSLSLRTSSHSLSLSLFFFSRYMFLHAGSRCLPAAKRKLTVSSLTTALLLCVILFA